MDLISLPIQLLSLNGEITIKMTSRQSLCILGVKLEKEVMGKMKRMRVGDQMQMVGSMHRVSGQKEREEKIPGIADKENNNSKRVVVYLVDNLDFHIDIVIEGHEIMLQ